MAARGIPGADALVVGGAGFIGSNLVRHLLEQGAGSVLVVDNLLSAERSGMPDDRRVTFLQGSIADDAVLERLDDSYDLIWHLATYHGNQSSIANPLEDHDNNLVTTLKLLERIRGFRRLRRFVYAASGCVLAPHTVEPAEPVTEEGPVPFDLDSPYQISKVVGEFYSVYYHRQHGLPTVRARFQNVYGPGEILGAGRWRGTAATVWRNVVPTFVYRALKGLPLMVDDEGIATRDFIHVDDVVRGLVLCATAGRPGDVYNLASGTETSIRALADLIKRLARSRSRIEFGPRRPWDHAGRRVGSPVKARRDLGFGAEVGLEDGLRWTIAWTRDNLALIDACVERHAPMLRTAYQTSP